MANFRVTVVRNTYFHKQKIVINDRRKRSNKLANFVAKKKS